MSHERLSRIEQRDNQLLFAGKTPAELAAIAGQTPCYIYDSEQITARVVQLRDQLPPAVHLHYAIKANPLPAVVDLLAGRVDGLDVASHGELLTALASGMAPSKISFAGPAKSLTELRAAIVAGVVINAESSLELARIAVIASELGCRPKVAVRINPGFELKGAGMKMSGGGKPFGIDAELFGSLYRGLEHDRLELVGLHIFSGSQNLRADALSEAQEQTLALAASLCEQVDFCPQQVNIGGGFGVPYFPGELPLDVEAVAGNLANLMRELPPVLQQSEIHLELGRYLVAEAGIYLCQIRDKKQSRGQTYLMTDGGMHHHLANSGNFGQVLRRNYPVVLANRLTADSVESVNVAGPLCTPLDIVADKVTLPQASVGDYLAVLQSGAYGASASPQQFLGHGVVPEVLL